MRKSTIKRTAAVIAVTGCAAAFLIVATGAASGNWIVEPSKISPALSYSYTTAAQTTAAQTTIAQTTTKGGGGGSSGGSSSEPTTPAASTTDVSTTATPSAVTTTTAAEPAPLPRGGSGGNNDSPVFTTSPDGSVGGGENTTFDGIIGEPNPDIVVISDTGEIVSPATTETTAEAVNVDVPDERLPPRTGVGSVAAVPLVSAAAVVLIARVRKRG